MIRFHVIASGGSSVCQSVWDESQSFDTEKEAQDYADWVRKERGGSDGGSLSIIRGECIREESWD